MSIYTCLELLSGMLPQLPLFCLLHTCLFRGTRRTSAYLVFALYLSAVYTVVGLPNAAYIRFDLNVNLIPFRDMLAGLTGTVLNVVLFVPFGFFLTFLWKEFHSFKRTVLYGFLLSLAIELLQLLTLRATDVNDLITNTLGAALGWCLGRLGAKLFPTLAGIGRKQELPIIFGSAAAVMFFVQPLLVSLIYSLL